MNKIILKALWWICEILPLKNNYVKKIADKIAIKLFVRYCYTVARENRQKGNYTNKPRLAWFPIPIISFSYWANALKQKQYASVSLMETYYSSINKSSDYDLYLHDIKFLGIENQISRFIKFFPLAHQFLWVAHIIRNYDIVHIPCSGGILHNTPYWQLELTMYKEMGIKIIALPYGADHYRYSTIYDQSWKHGLLVCYPETAKKEKEIQQKIDFLVIEADCIMAGFQFDSLGRWDILPYAIYPIDCSLWQPSTKQNNYDGINGVVKISHTPNHRGVKGTEFIIQAVEELQKEGLMVELILIEKKQNDEVLRIMQTEIDIHVEQLFLSYALSAIEGMSSGLPVLACLENEIYTRVFRRFSYLNECPILSTIPENIKENLKILITNPKLRQELGRAGREYAMKYHSFEAMQFIFEKIYDKIWYQKDIDLINLFHPVFKNSYNNSKPIVKHPLHENRLPAPIKDALMGGEKYPIVTNKVI